MFHLVCPVRVSCIIQKWECVQSPCVGFRSKCGTLTPLLKSSDQLPRVTSSTLSIRQSICRAPSCPAALRKPNHSKDTDIDWTPLIWIGEGEHNLSPHSESIIYLSPSNLECQAIHSNLHLHCLVWAKLSSRKEELSSRSSAALGCCLECLIFWCIVYMHSPTSQSKSWDVPLLLHKPNLVVLVGKYEHHRW